MVQCTANANSGGLIVAGPKATVVAQTFQPFTNSTSAAQTQPSGSTSPKPIKVKVLLRGANDTAMKDGTEAIWVVGSWYDDLPANLSLKGFNGARDRSIPKNRLVAIIFDDDEVNNVMNACVTYTSDDGTGLSTTRGRLVGKDNKSIVFSLSTGRGSIQAFTGASGATELKAIYFK